jgi:hypothetical protein
MKLEGDAMQKKSSSRDIEVLNFLLITRKKNNAMSMKSCTIFPADMNYDVCVWREMTPMLVLSHTHDRNIFSLAHAHFISF